MNSALGISTMRIRHKALLYLFKVSLPAKQTSPASSQACESGSPVQSPSTLSSPNQSQISTPTMTSGCD